MAASNLWSWKEEPSSPPLFAEEDGWFDVSDNVAIEVELLDEPNVSRAETASRLLQDLDKWVKPEEPFPNWLEEKIDLPIFDDLPPPISLAEMTVKSAVPLAPQPSLETFTAIKHSPPSSPPPAQPIFTNFGITRQKTTPSVLNQIEIVTLKLSQTPNIAPLTPIQFSPAPVLEQVVIEQTPVFMPELDYAITSHDTLTPPESPKQSEYQEIQVMSMLQEMQPHELDELVRMRVESLVESSEIVADTTCSSSIEESESIMSPSSDSSYSDPDPEWLLQSSAELKSPKKRRATKPYTRAPPEEKRIRKKEQNKNAATRYRMKKKQEFEDVQTIEKHMKQKNEDMKTELVEVKREIKYLKNLMRDLLKAKGLIQ